MSRSRILCVLPLVAFLTACPAAISAVDTGLQLTCAALASVNVGGIGVGQVCKGLEDAVGAFLTRYAQTSPTLAKALVPPEKGAGAPIFVPVKIGATTAFFVPAVAAELSKPETKTALEAELHAKGLL